MLTRLETALEPAAGGLEKFCKYLSAAGMVIFMIMVALTRRQAGLLRDFLRREDPEAFLTIVNSSEIIGKGFQSV